MTFVVNHDVVGFQIAENDIAFMQCLNGQKHLAKVLVCSLLIQTALPLQYSAKISARAEIKDEEQLCLCLEGVVEANDERVLCVGQHVTLCLCIPHQVVSKDLRLGQYLHGEKFASSELADKVDFAK